MDPLTKSTREEPRAEVLLHSPAAQVRPTADAQLRGHLVGALSPRPPAALWRVARCVSADASALRAAGAEPALGDISAGQRDLQDTVERLASQMREISEAFREWTHGRQGERVYSPRPEVARGGEESSPEVHCCGHQWSRHTTVTPGSSTVYDPEVCGAASAAHSLEDADGASGVLQLRQAVKALQEQSRSLETRNVCLEARNKCLEEALCELCRRVGSLEDRLGQTPSASPRAVRLPPRQLRASPSGQASTPVLPKAQWET